MTRIDRLRPQNSCPFENVHSFNSSIFFSSLLQLAGFSIMARLGKVHSQRSLFALRSVIKPIDVMKYTLLTGSTGLVGRYLLRDLLARDRNVAVLVRSNRLETAAQRIEAVMARWERLAGHALPRPLVFDGDLRQSHLGLDEQQRSWLSENCDTMLHNAASMSFREDQHGEPFRTNVDGVGKVLEFCRETGIRKFHHVSTAYVCGLRTGRVYENELDLGQENGNVYEVSKVAGEKLVRAADFLDETTVYRPASVVGDTETGYTTSAHGFYLPLQLAYIMADKVPPEFMGERFVRLLGLRGDEGKNLVPVDWLSAAIVHIVVHPELHGPTYHLTNPRPVAVQLIQQVVQEAIAQLSTRRFQGTLSEAEIAGYENLFRQYMEVYRSHWRDDPIFDRSHTDAALGQLPCPELDREKMFRIAAYPVQHNFVLNRSEPAAIAFHPDEHLRQLVVTRSGLASDIAASDVANADRVGLEVSGCGGGQWRLSLHDGRVVGLELGLGAADGPRFYLSSQTFSSLVAKRCTVERSLAAGRVVIERGAGENGGRQDFVKILKSIVSAS